MKVLEKGKYMSSEDDMVLKMREEEMKLTQLLAPIDITLNDFRQTISKQDNVITELKKLKEEVITKLNTFETLKNQLIREQGERINKVKNAYEAYKLKADNEIIKLKKELEKKEKEILTQRNYILEYEEDISALQMINNEMSQKQIKKMEEEIQNLRAKLGDKTIPLESLADGLKRYAEVHGFAKGKDLLLSFSYILKHERVWTDNVESLEDFFIAAEEENRKALVKLENNPGGIVQITKNEKE